MVKNRKLIKYSDIEYSNGSPFEIVEKQEYITINNHKCDRKIAFNTFSRSHMHNIKEPFIAYLERIAESKGSKDMTQGRRQCIAAMYYILNGEDKEMHTAYKEFYKAHGEDFPKIPEDFKLEEWI